MKNSSIETSAVLTVLGIILLFSTAVIVTLIAPSYIDPTWTKPTCSYQMQMYEIADPNFYISSTLRGGKELEYVNHLKRDFTLLAFQETETVRIVAPEHLSHYVTRYEDPILKLTSRLLLLREPTNQEPLNDQVLELYEKEGDEAFSLAMTDGILEDWVDQDFKIMDETVKQDFHTDAGVIYVNNPVEYRIKPFRMGEKEGWKFDPKGEPIVSLEQLKGDLLRFHSRKELIHEGEKIFAAEGCWYCHTDQTRTLIQDVVLNGSDSYPAPPSSANEYIYQEITFPGTKRIAPDLSRVGVKRPWRDWHQSHFWSPKTESKGSVMPAFRHFFDFDPRGTRQIEERIPNYRFEAIYQYLMTKGTRITSPTEAWWLGKDPVHTLEIIEGKNAKR